MPSEEILCCIFKALFFSLNAPTCKYILFELDLTICARHALLQMIDYLVKVHGLTKEQAYILCSVAVDLRVGQVVDVPNFIVSAVLNMDVFDKYRN